MNTHDNTGKSLTLIKGRKFAAIPLLTCDFRNNHLLCQDFDTLIALARQRRSIEQQEAKIQQRIQAAIGQAQKAVFTQGYAVWVKGRDHISLNAEAVLAQFPVLLDEFPQVHIAPSTLELRATDVVVEYPDLREQDYA